MKLKKRHARAVAQFPLTSLAALLYATGYVTRKVFVEAPLWIWTAVRLGWRDAKP